MPAAFFTTVRNPEPFRRGLIPITLISRPLSLATVQEVLETGGDDEEEKGRKEGTLSEMHLQGVVSRRDLRWMRGLAEEGRGGHRGLADEGTAGVCQARRDRFITPGWSRPPLRHWPGTRLN